VIVERLCARPGAGDLLWRAIALRDAPVATGVVVALAACTATVGVIVDLARRAWDPRLRRPA
jgi:peptide/nickel transport system permease protein